MSPGELGAVVVAHGALTAGGLGLLAVVQSTRPGYAARAAAEADVRPGRSLLVGVGAAISWLGLASLGEQAGVKVVGGALVLVAGVLIALYPPLLSIIVAALLIFIGISLVSIGYYQRKYSRHFENPVMEFFFRFLTY